MALTTTEKKIADVSSLGGLVAGIATMGLAALNGSNVNLLAASTGACAFGVSSFMVSHLYDKAGQKLVAWQALNASDKSIRMASAKDIDSMTKRLQRLEYAIDHRIDVISDSASKNAQVAMGAWVHAAKNVLEKSTLFDVAASPIDRDAAKLPSDWAKVSKQLQARVSGYSRMMNTEIVQPVSETIINYGHPTT